MGGSENYFLMLSPKIIKSQNSHYGGGGGWGVSKNYFLMVSPKIIKSQIPISGWGGGGGVFLILSET